MVHTYKLLSLLGNKRQYFLITLPSHAKIRVTSLLNLLNFILPNKRPKIFCYYVKNKLSQFETNSVRTSEKIYETLKFAFSIQLFTSKCSY